MTVEAYKTNNVLRTEVTSRDVAELAAEMCGPLFAKTTGAQVPVDGGNERVIWRPAVETMRWRDGRLELIDQRLLPGRFEYRDAAPTLPRSRVAIRAMVGARRARRSGCAAAFGVALEAQREKHRSPAQFSDRDAGCVADAGREPADRGQPVLGARSACAPCSRGTAIPPRRPTASPKRALALFHADVETNRAIGRAGAALLSDGARILTHCNTGALATAGHGTALGVVRSARDAGKRVSRDRHRDAPLPAGRAPHRLGADPGADTGHAHHRQHGRAPDAHAGRSTWSSSAPTASPPTATSPTRSAPTRSRCWRSGIAFPSTSPRPSRPIDTSVADGSAIPIEERGAAEVTGYGGVRWAPEGVAVSNPAFDVTPASLVAALITEKGVLERPDSAKILRLSRDEGPGRSPRAPGPSRRVCGPVLPRRRRDRSRAAPHAG